MHTAKHYKEQADNSRDEGAYRDAIKSYEEAIAIEPHYWQAHANLALVFERTNQLSSAILHAEKALHINPISELHDNLGRILYKSNNFHLATIHHKEAIKLKPELISAHLNLGNSLRKEKKFKESISAYKKTIELDPSSIEAHINLGNLLKYQGHTIKSINVYKQAKLIDPNNILIISNLFICYRTICDWDKANVISKELDILKDQNHTTSATGNYAINPFINLYRQLNATQLLNDTAEWCNIIFSDCHNHALFNSSLHKTRHKNKKLRIGYISGDFHNHPVGILTHNLFKHHNKSMFEIYIYSYSLKESNNYRVLAEKGSDYFRDITYLNDSSSSKLIFNDKIDILIDLTGFTSNGRCKICAYKPAPIQINYLGFPGSSGAKHYDYIITDHILTPYGYEAFYSEKLIRLPNCYQVNSQKITLSDQIYTRSYFGLPESYIIFCSFNNPRKINSTTFDIWMTILLKVKNSAIWLLKTENIQKEKLIKEAKIRGVSPERIIFTKSMPLSTHIKRHILADIALDTIGYNGGMTTSLSLYANTPVVTLAGDKYISRMSASLLGSVSLNNLITYTSDEYIELAVKLATDHCLLSQTKETLAANIQRLYNTDIFATDIEDAYIKIWSNYMKGNKPSNFDI